MRHFAEPRPNPAKPSSASCATKAPSGGARAKRTERLASTNRHRRCTSKNASTRRHASSAHGPQLFPDHVGTDNSNDKSAGQTTLDVETYRFVNNSTLVETKIIGTHGVTVLDRCMTQAGSSRMCRPPRAKIVLGAAGRRTVSSSASSQTFGGQIGSQVEPGGSQIRAAEWSRGHEFFHGELRGHGACVARPDRVEF